MVYFKPSLMKISFIILKLSSTNYFHQKITKWQKGIILEKVRDLFSSRRLVLFHICTKFRENMTKCFRADWTAMKYWRTDQRTDRRTMWFLQGLRRLRIAYRNIFVREMLAWHRAGNTYARFTCIFPFVSLYPTYFYTSNSLLPAVIRGDGHKHFCLAQRYL